MPLIPQRGLQLITVHERYNRKRKWLIVGIGISQSEIILNNSSTAGPVAVTGVTTNAVFAL